MPDSRKALYHLAVDIGNTNVVLGLFQNNRILDKWRLNTRKNVTGDEILFRLKELFSSGRKTSPEVSDIAIASVVPSITYQWSKALKECFRCRTHIINSDNCMDLKLGFKHPEEIGADRLSNIIACRALGIKNAIIIDFGTATTFDVYHKEVYLGGAICPGVQSSMSALTENASRLWDVDLFWNKKITGQNTDDALRNGVLYGTLGQVEYIVKQIIKEQKMRSPEIIATGGLSGLIGSRCPLIQKIDKNLTLVGLNYYIQSHSHSDH